MESSRAANADAEVVHTACRRTLAEHGARIYVTWVTLREDGWTEPWMWQVGDADPDRRRLHLSSFVSDQSPLVKAFKDLGQRWPWLADEDQVKSEHPEPVAERIYIGRRLFLRAQAGWKDEGNHSNTTDFGLWALEAAQGMRAASVTDEKNVRGERCRCYLGEVHPADVAGQPEIERCPVTIEPPTPLIEPDPAPNKAMAMAHIIIDWMKIITIDLLRLWKKRRAYRRRMNAPTVTS